MSKRENGGRVPGGSALLQGALIVRDPHILEGKPFLAGTRMGIDAVIAYWQTYGGDVERILREFPHLTRDQILAAVAFYDSDETHREEIDGILRRNEEAYDRGS